ncbi:MAG: hypothetical protein ACK4IA_03495 [Paracoccus hibiscisoli]|uniref:hypothetical protein n=1 Tax=Paracoccus hibiscisoli TaxID=2023261 RepID=UPI00391C4C9C
MPFSDTLDTLLPQILPQALREIVGRFTTDGVTSTPFAGGTLHRGTLRAASDEPLRLGIGTLDLPGVTAGIPFRLAVFDAPQGRFHLDLVLDGLSLTLDDLVAADFVPEQGTVPRRLVRRTRDTDVVIQGRATLRLARASQDDAVVVLFVDPDEAADPLAPTGGVVSLTCTPPHFFLGRSQFAITLSQLVFDASDSVSPPLVTGAGQGAEWMGFAIAEATFYAPPNAIGRGGFSGGVRNLLLGAPRGVQGEVEVQWGRTALDPATFVFTQDGQTPQAATGSDASWTVAISANQDDRVTLAAALTLSAPPEAGSWTARWHWPDGQVTEGVATAGQIGHGQVLRVTLQEQLASGLRLSHPEVTFRMVASGSVPRIHVVVVPAGADIVRNVAHLSGPAADMAGLRLLAESTAAVPGSFDWVLLPGGTPQARPDLVLDPALLTGSDAPTERFVLLRETDAQGRRRVARLRLQITDAPLWIGATGGVFAATAPTVPLLPGLVEASYDLTDFHAQGLYRSVTGGARVDAAQPGGVALPDNILARVTFDTGTAPPSPPAPARPDRHVQLLFQFAKAEVTGWGLARPARDDLTGDAGIQAQLRAWAAQYPGASFVMIGRCDDLGDDALNRRLARDRVGIAHRLLTDAGGAGTAVAAGDVAFWGEQDGPPSDAATDMLTAQEAAADRLIRAHDGTRPLVDRTGWPDRRDTAHESEETRRQFRRVDIYAVGGTPAAGATPEPLASARQPHWRRMLMPGPAAQPAPVPPLSPKDDTRMRLLVAWDKPTGEGLRDLIPSKAEFEYAWSPTVTPLPPLGGQPVDMGREVLTVYGAWTHDDATDFTQSQLGIRSDGDPAGLIRITQPNLVAAMALGPMLLSEVDADTGTVEGAGRLAALAAGTAFAQADLGGGPLVGPGSEAVIKSIEARAEFDSLADPGQGWKVSLTGDYSTKLHVNTGSLGLSTDPEHPVRFRYKGVGVRYDSRASGFWNQVGLEYPTDAMQVEDPGKWKIDGPLQDLLRAVETALGLGSLWVETRFAFALTIGVVEISEAVIRVTFTRNATPIPDVDFSLRGLTARVNIPATLTGEGRLRIEDPGGVIRAGLELELIPLQLKAQAAFAMAQIDGADPYTFVSLYAKVQFPVGIPLGPSGAAIHGFVGMTAINGERAVTATDDVVAREIGWWTTAPESKYRPRKDRHALGLGAVVGTLPDASFSMSAQGMIVVAFPDPEVIFAVEVSLLSIPDRTAKEKGGGSGQIIGLIVIDDQAVSVAVSARYDIPKILSVVAPMSARFPYRGGGNYVRLGSDGQPGRAGEPVTLTLLPDTLNLRAFAYLMIQQDGITKLGGHPDFTFEGFSVGFGAGARLEWKAGPIRLSASVLLLAGFGTDPVLIKAGIFVRGALDLVVVSIAARGEIVLTYQDGALWMDGEFCGRVDLFFFSISGCVRFRIGNPAIAAPQAPPPPVASVALIDRGGRIMGEAAPDGMPLRAEPLFRLEPDPRDPKLVINRGADPRDNHTVWPDTAPVVNFRHYIRDAIPAGGQFDPLEQPSGAVWFGSNRLQYTYRLDNVRLLRARDGAPVTGPRPLESVWTTSPARQPGSAGPQAPSGAEVTSLKLLDWQPWAWALPTTDGGASQPGDPAQTVEDLCRPVPRPARACLLGEMARTIGPHAIRLRRDGPAPGPYPSRFALTGAPEMQLGSMTLSAEALAGMIAGTGGLILPGAVVDLPGPVTGPTGPLTRGYRLPEAQAAAGQGAVRTALPWTGRLDRRIRDARLLLLICDGTSRPARPEPRRCFDFDGLTPDRKLAQASVPGFRLEAADPDQPFMVTDKVAVSQGSALAGTDGRPDILIAPPGLILRPSGPARIVELHLLRGDTQGINVTWTDTQGGTGRLPSIGATLGSLVLRIDAAADIDRIRIETKSQALFLYRICVLSTHAADACVDFGGLYKGALDQPTLRHAGIRLSVIDPRTRMGLADWVDSGASPARRGADGTPELTFPDAGIELVPDTPWQAVSLAVFSGAGPVTARGYAGDGTLIAEATDPARDPVELHLAASQGIARVILTGGRHEAVLFRICETREAGPVCHDLRDLKPGSHKRLEHRGLTYVPADPAQMLEVMDVVTGTDPLRIDPDGLPELLVPPAGLVIGLDRPLAGLELHLVALGGQEIRATALGMRGAVLEQVSAPGDPDRAVTLSLQAEGMASVRIEGGDKLLLLRVCTIAQGSVPRRDDPPVTVRSSGPGGWTGWTATPQGRVTDAAGRACTVIAFEQPRALRDIDDLAITAPGGRRVMLLSLCGTDVAATMAAEQDAAARAALAQAVTDTVNAGPVAAARQVLLEPGEEYRLEIDWRWQAWTSNERGTDSPPAVLPDRWTPAAGQPPLRQTYRFRIAPRDLTGPEPQDGLNEYLFDPRDLARYIGRTEPVDGRDTVFTDDPIWVHFTTGHVEEMVARYGRKLVIDVQRTDPPPRPAAAGPAGPIPAALLEMLRAWAPDDVLLPLERRVNAAVRAAACLPDGDVAGGLSLGARLQLDPQAMYDLRLLAPRLDGSDPVVVQATRFVTSRHANLTALIDELGFARTGSAPYPPDEMILEQTALLPTGNLVVSDLSLSDALRGIGADTLPLPQARSRVIALWRALPGGQWGVAGLLLDSPEPLRREGALRLGNKIIEGLRCSPEEITIRGASGTTVLTPVRATRNWTRVLFTAPAPVTPLPGSDLVLVMRGGLGLRLTARRTIGVRPVLLETEGF